VDATFVNDDGRGRGINPKPGQEAHTRFHEVVGIRTFSLLHRGVGTFGLTGLDRVCSAYLLAVCLFSRAHFLSFVSIGLFLSCTFGLTGLDPVSCLRMKYCIVLHLLFFLCLCLFARFCLCAATPFDVRFDLS
jgi:hypothetical protein